MQEINRHNYKKLLKRKNIDVDVKINFIPGSNTDFNSITLYFTNGTGETKKLFIDRLDKLDLSLMDLDTIRLQPANIKSIPKFK